MSIEPLVLPGEEIKKLVSEKLDEYKGMSFLERFAMFMGKAQILEFGLKGILTKDYQIQSEDMERWTLGKTKNELERVGIRPDFINLLHSVVQYRNYAAHEMLVDNTITRNFANFSPRKLEGELFKGTYELEQLMILFDWCEEHKGWTKY